jgi:hypothetical protein
VADVITSSSFVLCGGEWVCLCYSWFYGLWFMVVDATFNDISIISWRSVLLVEKTGVPGENHRPVASHWQTLSHNVVSSTPRHERGKITTTTVPLSYSMNCLNKYKFNFVLIYRTSSHTIIKEHPGILKVHYQPVYMLYLLWQSAWWLVVVCLCCLPRLSISKTIAIPTSGDTLHGVITPSKYIEILFIFCHTKSVPLP